jgi:hypothetical protein
MILKKLVESKSIEMWLNKTEIEQWRNNPYPNSVDAQPTIHYDNDLTIKESITYGMFYDNLYSYEYPEIKFCYLPGSSSYLGGLGLEITKASPFKDEAFKFIELLINEDYPYCTESNISVTPFENVHGQRCKDEGQRTKKELCTSILALNGTYPYYYIRNNITSIVYLTHLNIGNDRGISIETNNSLNSAIYNNIFNNNTNYICDNEVNYEKHTVTYYSKYKIELAISKNEKIILKSMMDVETITSEQTQEMICSIYEDSFKLAKPMQFPYGNFPEINNFQEKAPISLLFAHLYYKHNNTETPFERIIEECCDIIDDSLKPICNETRNIKFKVNFDQCDRNHKTKIEFINCKLLPDSPIESVIDCHYIPYLNFNGIIVIITTIIASFIEIIYLIFIIM